MGNKYKFGLILGRFNPLHIGHEYLINYALSKCDILLIFIGSANKNLSLSNPFSYEEREYHKNDRDAHNKRSSSINQSL